MYSFSNGKLIQARRTLSRRLVLLGAACLLLLFVQTSAIKHTHEDTSLFQPQCDLCIKLNSNDDSLVSAAIPFQFQAAVPAYEGIVASAINATQPTPRSRAPPHA